MRLSQRGRRLGWSARGYALARSLAPLRRRPLAALVTLAVLGVALTLPALLWFGAASLERLAARDGTRASLTAYLDTEVSDLDGALLADELAERPGIESTRYVSRAEALATLDAGSDLGPVLEILDGNPLPGAIVIYPERGTDGGDAQAAERMATFADELGRIGSIDRVRYDLVWVERLAAALALLRALGALLGGFLVLTALLVIGNTVRLELLRRRAEREVTDLLGADRAFRDRPFLYAGALYGLLGGLIALGLALLAWTLLKRPADTLVALYGGTASLAWPDAAHLAAVPAIATALGLAGALVSLYGPSRVKVRDDS